LQHPARLLLPGFFFAVNTSMKIIPTWSVPMYQFEWDKFADHQQQLIDKCYELQSNNSVSNVASNIKQGLYESDFDFFQSQDPSVQELLEWCRGSVFAAATNANHQHWPQGARIGVNVHESWCHITRSGGYHDMHMHPNSSWSGIFYVRAGESNATAKNGCNRFYSPLIPGYTDIGTQWCSRSSSFDMPPTDGELIVFPSWILHSAMPYTGDTERIVVAFNCQFIDGTNTNI
jgi:uncharacterized protein (TIGR02466 family)